MNAVQMARLYNARCELDALISERCAMASENRHREVRGLPPAFGEEHFQRNADAMRAYQVDPQEFGS